MKSKRLFLLMVAAVLVSASLRFFAETPITFELLTNFDYPAGSNTNARAINERGDIAGSFSADSSTVRPRRPTLVRWDINGLQTFEDNKVKAASY